MATKTNTTINGKDYYRIQRVIGHKYGKPITRVFYGKSKAEAQKKYEKWKADQIREGYENAVIADLSLFCERADEFIDNALKPSAKYAQGTIDRYVSAYTHHIEDSFLSGMVANKVKASDIQKFYNDLDVSQQTLRQIHKFMSAFYKWMVRNEYAHDVLSAVEIPRKRNNSRHDEIIIWTDDEIKTITDNLGNHRLRFMVYLMLFTGARVGEALGLKYEDIRTGNVSIMRQCYMGEIKPPKANSIRNIPIHPILAEELKRHKAWHKEEMKKNGYKTDFVFTTASGSLLDTRNLQRSLSRFYKRIGVEPKHNHAYRSTFCTQLCKNGVPLEVASKLLGHKSILVTAKHYALVQPENKREAIDMLHYSFQKDC